MIVIAMSSCLLGESCRYDAKSKVSAAAFALKGVQGIKIVPICPEVSGGLTTPRPPAEIQKLCEAGIFEKRVINQEGNDVTKAYALGAQETLRMAKQEGAKLAVLKAKSPSCGSGVVYDGSFSRILAKGWGIAAELFRQNGITVIDESELDGLQRIAKKCLGAQWGDAMEKMLESLINDKRRIAG